MASNDLFLWGQEELTPLELLVKYKEKFPRIVMVKEGFCGDHAWESLSQAEILLIHCCTSQKRVIAKDPQGRYYSFATAYDANFYPVKLKKRLSKKAKPFSELLEQYTLPFEVEVEKEDSCLLTTGAEDQCRPLKLHHLTITDTYEERFMKANLIRPEGLNKYVIKIAAYVKAKLTVSQSDEVLSQVISAAEKIDLRAQDTSQQILMYSRQMLEDKTEGNIYETLEPSKTLATSAVYDTMSKASTAGLVQYGQRETLFDPELAAMLKGPSKPVQKVGPSKPTVEATNSSLEVTRTPRDEKWNDIPADIGDLTCDELADCLKLLNLEKYCQEFKHQQINGALLKTLNVEDLKQDMQMTGIEAKKMMKFCNDGWRPNETLKVPIKGDLKSSTRA